MGVGVGLLSTYRTFGRDWAVQAARGKANSPRAEAMVLLALINAISASGITGVSIRVYADAKSRISGWAKIHRAAQRFPIWDQILCKIKAEQPKTSDMTS